MDTNDINKYKAALKKAADKINELDAKLKQAEESQEIAVIGYDCRFPGGANNPELFWERLRKGYDAVTKIKEDRFPADEYFSEDQQEKGKVYTQYGSFLDFDIKSFDNVHFEISPVEASSIDPQQRLLLEVSWCALENAGLNIDALKDSKTGVFIGIDAIDYIGREMLSGDTRNITPYTLVGVSSHAAAGRISYFYDFKGPSVCVSTACSSSLTALNMAVASLKSGQCDLALVGGVNIISEPEPYVALSQFHGLSPDGRCKTFDASADGFGRGEGCGFVILKKAKDAKKDGNTIEAIVKEVYIGQDGKSNGLYAPNGLADQRVITEALHRANLSVDDVDYIEAHGTGTSLGDFIEAQAVCAAFKNRKQPIKTGSVKTNIGHLEAAAGMASMIKVLLSFKHKQLPPSIHFHTPNPNIDWEKIQVVSELTDWESEGKKRRAGISAFGISGALAHVILEEPEEEIEEELPVMTANLLTFSTKNKGALLTGVKDLKTYLEQSGESLNDIAYTSNLTRSSLEYRFAAVASTKEQMIEEINRALHEEDAKKFYIGQDDGKRKKIAFLFTGQDSIHENAAKQFYDDCKEYRDCFDACDRRFQELLGISIKHAVFEGDEDLTCDDYSQPVIFSLEYSLTKLWDILNIRPDYVIGQSVGEYAALCYSGILDFEQASKMIALQSRATGTLTDQETLEAAKVYADSLDQLVCHKGTAKAISTVTGKLETSETFGRKEYWIEHSEKTIYFEKAMQEAERLGITTFIEIGGNDTLCGLASQYILNPDAVFVPTMRNDVDAYKQIMESLKQLYLKGVNPDLQGLYKEYQKKKVTLPNYPFEKKVYWKEKMKEDSKPGSEQVKISTGTLEELLQKQNEQLEQQRKIMEAYLKKQ